MLKDLGLLLPNLACYIKTQFHLYIGKNKIRIKKQRKNFRFPAKILSCERPKNDFISTDGVGILFYVTNKLV